MSVLQKLTEGIVGRSLQREGAALLEKWEATGLLEGIENDSKRQGMARLLENQASQLLKEASSMAAGDVEGFASVAFPIVRRVFGGLLANDLVSVQPMSLPSGLIFFMDFTYQDGRMGSPADKSVYGGGVTGSQIQTGVTDITEAGGGFYNLANAFSHATGTVAAADETGLGIITLQLTAGGKLVSALTEAEKKLILYDPDVLGNSTYKIQVLDCDFDDLTGLNRDQVKAIELQTSSDIIQGFDDGVGAANLGATTITHVRRLTQLVESTAGGGIDRLRIVLVDSTGSDTIDFAGTAFEIGADKDQLGVGSYPYSDQFTTGDALGSVVGTNNWPLEEPHPGTGNYGENTGKGTIAEIDIRVESIAVTAQTKKLKAKWSPELGQDLNAYHNLDAEVELTQILSEQIALEIDREILNDLVQGAKAGTYYWSRAPGLFVNRLTGAELGATAAAPDFTGTVSEWYETLVETINDVSAQIHRKTLRGGANFLVTSPEVANILEFTSGFRASVTHDADRGTVGAVNVGSMSRKWDVYVDPYFARNLILVGRKGGSFLESGYVYAPYVPLQVTPTIFGTEDFVPRKGVMTRYAKKMVRPDMYGLVVVRGLLGESGS
jgi:hypothetical protein